MKNKHTKKTKQLLSKIMKKYYKNHDNPFKGKHHTEESKNKIKQKRLGKKHTEATKKKISQNHRDTKGKNNPMFGRKGKLSPTFGRHLTYKQKEILKLKHSKENKLYTSSGYILIWNSKNKIIRKRVLEHRFIVEQIIKRKLNKGETIHHINGNKLNNISKNLYLFNTIYAHNLYTKLSKLQPEIVLKSNLEDIK